MKECCKSIGKIYSTIWIKKSFPILDSYLDSSGKTSFKV